MVRDELRLGLDHFMKSVEKILNLPGYVPIVSSFSGALRAEMGKVELIASLFIGAYVGFVTGDVDQGIAAVIIYAIHGLTNIGRGVVECIPLLGNFLCWIYDDVSRVAYPFENVVVLRGVIV